MSKPKHHRPSTIEQQKLIVKMYEEGKTVEEIAVLVELHPRSVNRALANAGVKRPVGPKQKVLDADMAKIYNLLRRREVSYDSLASEYGVTVTTMRKRVRDYEFELKRRLAYGIGDI